MPFGRQKHVGDSAYQPALFSSKRCPEDGLIIIQSSCIKCPLTSLIRDWRTTSSGPWARRRQRRVEASCIQRRYTTNRLPLSDHTQDKHVWNQKHNQRRMMQNCNDRRNGKRQTKLKRLSATTLMHSGVITLNFNSASFGSVEESYQNHRDDLTGSDDPYLCSAKRFSDD